WHEPEEYWHPLATAWYESLQRSGQAAFYQASDIAFAYFMAEVITRYLGAGLKMSGRLLDVILKGCTLLLATEASRRIAQMELTKIESRNIDAEITALMEEYAAAI
ncbi:phage terminase small subunit, partial [Streptomyces xanthochromogenes]